MTHLTKRVRRSTDALIREKGQIRPIIITLMPPNLIGFRAKGYRKTYMLTAEACYTMAVRADVSEKQKQKRIAKQAKKNEGRSK